MPLSQMIIAFPKKGRRGTKASSYPCKREFNLYVWGQSHFASGNFQGRRYKYPAKRRVLEMTRDDDKLLEPGQHIFLVVLFGG